MRIPHHLLSEETFESLVSQFVSEVEGSDFDPTPFSDRVQSAKELIEKGEIIILFSEMEEAPFLLTKSQCIERFKRIPEYLS
ncbi:YheU family protein [Vibrio parahaemolyticus]|mgnify:CR=1 FL=1